MGFQAQDTAGTHQVLQAPYKPYKTKEPFPKDYGGRSRWTEKERYSALNCIVPSSLENYAQEVRYLVCLVELRGIIKSFRWIGVSIAWDSSPIPVISNLIEKLLKGKNSTFWPRSSVSQDYRKVVQVFDDNKDLLYTLDTTMPAHLKESLEIAIQVCLSGTSAQFKSQEPSSSVETASFSSLHFTNQTQYLTHVSFLF